jgi:predicted O-methyltransferase YrrM
MSVRTLTLDERLYDYFYSIALREPKIMAALREETARHPMAEMQIAPETAPLLQLLVRLIGARRTIELGVYTGYSALATALALPNDGYVLACDVNADFCAMGQRYWRQAGVADKIDLVIAPALQTLDARIAAGESGSYDFAFVDADKPNYPAYYERLLQLMRPGGLIAFDNTLGTSGIAFIDQDQSLPNPKAMYPFNKQLHADERIDLSVIPLGEGLTLARKR